MPSSHYILHYILGPKKACILGAFQMVRDQKVVGSNPVAPTMKNPENFSVSGIFYALR